MNVLLQPGQLNAAMTDQDYHLSLTYLLCIEQEYKAVPLNSRAFNVP